MPSSDPYQSARASAVLVAGGGSSRLFQSGHQGPVKQLVELQPGRPVLLYALEALEAAETIAEVVLVVRAEDRAAISAALARREGLGKLSAIVEGGAERQDSVRNGLLASSRANGLVAIHDAARPLVAPQRIDACVRAAARHGAALLVVPVADTLKRSADGEFTAQTVDRRELYLAQTPQCFDRQRFLALIEAHRGPSLTDDAGLWEQHIGPVRLVPGDRRGFKITEAADLELARAWLSRRDAEGSQSNS